MPASVTSLGLPCGVARSHAMGRKWCSASRRCRLQVAYRATSRSVILHVDATEVLQCEEGTSDMRVAATLFDRPAGSIAAYPVTDIMGLAYRPAPARASRVAG